MRQLESKYGGECSRCGKDFAIGDPIMYEKQTGTFCLGCEPVEVEDIRTFRQSKIDAKNDRREEWAQARERRAAVAQGRNDHLMCRDSSGRADWALVTQPGHIPQRAQAIRAQEKAWSEAKAAAEHRARKIGPAVVKGDRERAREDLREKAREWVEVGMFVHTPLFGTCRVLRVNKKTVAVETEYGKRNEGLHWIRRLGT